MKKKTKTKKISGILAGISGEYFVAAELSKQGYIAALTHKNTMGIDILAANAQGSKSVMIQVKANQHGGKGWVMHAKGEKIKSKNLFYVFVNLNTKKDKIDYYIVPSRKVAKFLKTSHSDWLKVPSKKGKQHKDTSMRKFHIYDKNSKYMNNWKILGI